MEKIAVAVRLRPSTAVTTVGSRQWRIDDNRISLHRPGGSPIPFSTVNSFAFDHVFDKESTNGAVYGTITRPIIDAAVLGFNGSAFAYGQTSSGKTYTMNGSENDPGIIPLSVKDIFEKIEMIRDREFLIRVSYMEIYNEEINDLLCLGHQKLPIHESLERGVFVAGLTEEIVNSASQVFKLIKLGEENRHFGETNMNARSSRSHTIFRMVIESSAKDPADSDDVSTDAIRVSVLNLVDLAGSERIAKTGADGVRLKEGKYINKSLMVLGNVINKLSEGKQRAHIPYRDSKLTRILQSALGGNAKTSIICTVAPEEVHIEETRGTLQFASRAKRITNCAQINEILTDAALLKRQKLEIEELREKLQGSHSELLEQEILKQRNDMLKSEMAREMLAVELQEEKKRRESLENHIREHQKKIEILSDCLNKHQNLAKVGSAEVRGKGVDQATKPSEEDEFRTPNLKSTGTNFIARRSSYSNAIDSSPIPDAFGSVADEDLWMKLNKGCTTDLDMLVMTPDMRNGGFPSHNVDSGLPQEATESSMNRCKILENKRNQYKEELVSSKEQSSMLERECNLLKEENASLLEALYASEQNVEELKREKEAVMKDLDTEKKKMKDLKEEIRLFSLAFAKRENMLTSLYTKSKAMVENLKNCQLPATEAFAL